MRVQVPPSAQEKFFFYPNKGGVAAMVKEKEYDPRRIVLSLNDCSISSRINRWNFPIREVPSINNLELVFFAKPVSAKDALSLAEEKLHRKLSLPIYEQAFFRPYKESCPVIFPCKATERVWCLVWARNRKGESRLTLLDYQLWWINVYFCFIKG